MDRKACYVKRIIQKYHYKNINPLEVNMASFPSAEFNSVFQISLRSKEINFFKILRHKKFKYVIYKMPTPIQAYI